MHLRTQAIGSGIASAVYATWLVLHLGGETATGTVDGLGLLLASGGAAVMSARRAHLESGRGTRAGWALLSLSCATFVVSVLISTVYAAQGRTLPTPSIDDASFLTGAVAAMAAVLLLAERTRISSRAVLLLDGGIVASSLMLLSWLTATRAVLVHASLDEVAFAVNLTYPIADVVTIVIVLSALAHSRLVNPALLIVGVAMLSFAVSDSIYAYAESGTAYHGSTPLEVGWFTGYALIAVAARVGQGARTMQPGDELRRWQVLLPYVPVVPAAVAVLLELVRGHPLDAVTQVLMAADVTLVLVRQLLAVVEAHSLATRLRDTSAEQRLLIDQAPVGICRLDGASRIASLNGAFEAMAGRPASDLIGLPLADLLQLPGWTGLPTVGRAMEARLVQANGSVRWCATTIGRLRGPDGRVERSVAIVEDITDRRAHMDRAAHVQRLLLPERPPAIDGYDLAGACRPAIDVAGDFYDWTQDYDYLDLTVADVMGKGMASALVMAVLRTALRYAPADLPPAARVRLAASALGLGMTGEGLFVTLFHARLEPATGRLRYVDAGHGYCAIRRRDRTLVRLPVRSLPVGIWPEETYREGTVVLEPGDCLVVYSDGLVERPDRITGLDDLAPELRDGASASEMVGRLMDRTAARPDDDVTVVVLRRLEVGSGRARQVRHAQRALAGRSSS